MMTETRLDRWVLALPVGLFVAVDLVVPSVSFDFERATGRLDAS